MEVEPFNPLSLVFLVVVGMVTFFVLLRVSRQLQAGRRDESTQRSQAQQRPRVPQIYDTWEVRMHELARDLSAQLDTKYRAVQELIRQADERIARLETISGDRESRIDTGPGRERRLGAELSRPPLPSEPEGTAAPPKARRQAEIYAAADRGSTSSEIAAELELPVGEIELVLSLRRTHAAPGSRS